MPTRPKRFGEASTKAIRKQSDKARGSASERGYGKRWQRYRLVFLAEHPLCVDCEKEGKIEPAKEVDHIVPHRGDQALFWDVDNHQGLCKRHHSIKTRSGL